VIEKNILLSHLNLMKIYSGVISFAVAVGLLIYTYASIGINIMLCSGVHSEISGTVNFDSMCAFTGVYPLLYFTYIQDGCVHCLISAFGW
jgi:hypothetical protein